ncbi:putative beta-barrel protein YwiB [compost metagenome]
MTPKQRVSIRIESRIDGQESAHTAEGDLYLKGKHAYIRYEESGAELGKTTTLIRLDPDEVKIIRQGDIQSEQIFVPGEQRIGFYHTAQAKLELVVHTHDWNFELNNGLGHVSWSYDLYMAGDHAGLYRLKLLIQEGHRDERT